MILYHAIGLTLCALAVGIFVGGFWGWDERRQMDRNVRHYRRLYAETVARNAVLLRWYGGDNPLAVDAAATVEALSDDEVRWESVMGGRS